MDFENGRNVALVTGLFLILGLSGMFIVSQSGTVSPVDNVSSGEGTYYPSDVSEDSTQDNQTAEGKENSRSNSQGDSTETQEGNQGGSESIQNRSSYRVVEKNDFDTLKLLRDGKPEPGQSNILEVRDDGFPVGGAEVSINGESGRETRTDGMYYFGTPDTDEMVIEIKKNQKEARVIYDQE